MRKFVVRKVIGGIVNTNRWERDGELRYVAGRRSGNQRGDLESEWIVGGRERNPLYRGHGKRPDADRLPINRSGFVADCEWPSRRLRW